MLFCHIHKLGLLNCNAALVNDKLDQEFTDFFENLQAISVCQAPKGWHKAQQL
jgi:hypothetical protein